MWDGSNSNVGDNHMGMEEERKVGVWKKPQNARQTAHFVSVCVLYYAAYPLTFGRLLEGVSEALHRRSFSLETRVSRQFP